MSVKRVVPVASGSDSFTLYPLFDIHYGAMACNLKRLKADIQEIKDNPFALWLGGGDMIEGIDHLDPRYDPRVEAVSNIRRQVADFADLVAPIYDKCIGLLEGNHEFQIERHKGVSAYREICYSLGRRTLPSSATETEVRKAGAQLALGVQGYIKLLFKMGRSVRALNIWAEHGAGGGGLPGGDALMLGRMLGRHECHIALCGHRHVVQTLKSNADRMNKNGDMEVYKRIGAICGAYLDPFLAPDEDGYPINTYSEKKHRSPLDADSWVRVHIRPFDGHNRNTVYSLETG